MSEHKEKKFFYFFLFLWLLRCFTSPGLLHTAMYSLYSNCVLPQMGSPIRKSPDQSLLGSSPRLIAPCDVLLRWIVSRHPPYALILRTKKTHNCALPLLCLTERILMQFFSHMFLLSFSWHQETHNFVTWNMLYMNCKVLSVIWSYNSCPCLMMNKMW